MSPPQLGVRSGHTQSIWALWDRETAMLGPAHPETGSCARPVRDVEGTAGVWPDPHGSASRRAAPGRGALLKTSRLNGQLWARLAVLFPGLQAQEDETLECVLQSELEMQPEAPLRCYHLCRYPLPLRGITVPATLAARHGKTWHVSSRDRGQSQETWLPPADRPPIAAWGPWLGGRPHSAHPGGSLVGAVGTAGRVCSPVGESLRPLFL